MLGIFLVDSTTSDVKLGGGSSIGQGATAPKHPINGGYEDFQDPLTFGAFKSLTGTNSSNRRSLFQDLLRYFKTNPPGFNHTSPSLLSLCYYPISIVTAEWTIYMNLMSRYLLHYEYSLRDISITRAGDDLIDLQRWRRRSKQTQHKLEVVESFVKYRSGKEPENEAWTIMAADLSYLIQQLGQSSQSLEQMIPVATSMVQLLDSRRSVREAINVRRLTYVALIFAPLSFVASLFSIPDEIAPGKQRFWVYFAVAIPLALIILAVSASFGPVINFFTESNKSFPRRGGGGDRDRNGHRWLKMC